MGDNHSPFDYNHNNNMTIRQHYDLREKHTVMKQAVSTYDRVFITQKPVKFRHISLRNNVLITIQMFSNLSPLRNILGTCH